VGSTLAQVFVYLFMQRLTVLHIRVSILAVAVLIAVNMSSLCDLEVLPNSSTQASWPDVKRALDSWAIASKFTYKTVKKDPDKGRYICRVARCPWVVNVTRSKDSMLKIRVTNRQHTCFGAPLPKR
jgi:hypothetical protein